MQQKNNSFTSKILSILQNKFFFPIFLLLILLVAYAVLIPWLGFYGDDWSMMWLAYRTGNLNLFFSMNRPTKIYFYNLFTTWLQPVPWQWLLLSVVFSWLTAVLVYVFIKKSFPIYQNEASWFAILFALYPGYLMSYIPFSMLNAYVQPLLLTGSLFLMTLWIKNKEHPLWQLIFSLILAFLNLFFTEYFLFLELLRPVIIWFVIAPASQPKKKWVEALKIWAPFLLLFVGILVWKGLTLQGSNPYNAVLLNDFIKQPLQTIGQFMGSLLHDFYTVILQPLIGAIIPTTTLGKTTHLIYWLIVLLISALIFAYLFFVHPTKEKDKEIPKRNSFVIAGIALIAFILGGLPFWIPKLQVVYGFDTNNRFALTQALSATFFLFAILLLIPKRYRVFQIGIVSLLAGLFCGTQFVSANLFREEWVHQEEFFRDLSWRVLNLQPGTIIIMNDPHFVTIGDNAMTTEVNWNYNEKQNPTQLDYFVYFDHDRLAFEIPDYHLNQIVFHRHIIGSFSGNTNQTLVVHFSPSSCLRVIDPETDKLNVDITDYTRDYFAFSNSSVIQADNYLQSRVLDAAIYRDQFAQGWCYYYEKADLARQLKDWTAVTQLGEKAFAINEHPNNGGEVQPFIEGYAMVGNWEKAIQLSDFTLQLSSDYNRMTCALWQRIDRNTQPSPQKQASLAHVTSKTDCIFN